MPSADSDPTARHWAQIHCCLRIFTRAIVSLLLAVLTCGLFSTVWMFVEAVFVNKLQTGSKAILFYAIGVAALFASGVIGRAADAKVMGGLVQLGGFVLIIAGHFSMKSALEDHYTRVERIGLQLSGVMTFFFNVFYFQYHFSEIRRWERDRSAAHRERRCRAFDPTTAGYGGFLLWRQPRWRPRSCSTGFLPRVIRFTPSAQFIRCSECHAPGAVAPGQSPRSWPGDGPKR